MSGLLIVPPSAVPSEPRFRIASYDKDTLLEDATAKSFVLFRIYDDPDKTKEENPQVASRAHLSAMDGAAFSSLLMAMGKLAYNIIGNGSFLQESISYFVRGLALAHSEAEAKKLVQ